ncbi:hypothetical protein DO97_02410 [Neosynechococcus sphagnicola sy1]|uniref:Uncharacterized protein n=1 Tax=Neosynechococcus sphagnicola sy1 TaxID=1497020 RepID=A0A098TLP6_9CYAN|nr:hypothetical protein DO97_02410 [Neosynechococcus sphagnicola sy1]
MRESVRTVISKEQVEVGKKSKGNSAFSRFSLLMKRMSIINGQVHQRVIASLKAGMVLITRIQHIIFHLNVIYQLN